MATLADRVRAGITGLKAEIARVKRSRDTEVAAMEAQVAVLERTLAAITKELEDAFEELVRAKLVQDTRGNP